MAIYINHLLQTLSFSSSFRRFEKEKFLCRPTMVADNISKLVAPQNFFHFYGPVYIYIFIYIIHIYICLYILYIYYIYVYIYI